LSLRRKNSGLGGLPIGSLVLVVWGLVLTGLHGYGQEKAPVTFGTVTAADFVLRDATDSAADAVVEADIGSTRFERSGPVYKLRFYTLFRQTKRIHIITHKGFDAATVMIPLLEYKGDKEEIIELTATTYNLDAGRVLKTELDKASVFVDKPIEHLDLNKFTFPGVREGSIVEYTYVVKSPFTSNLHSWVFQGIYPCHWSEYQADVPDLFRYLTFGKGNLPYTIHTTQTRDSSFGMFDRGYIRRQLTLVINSNRWVVKDVPSFREEPYTTTISNYVARIEFQFLSFDQSAILGWSMESNALPSWLLICRELLKSDKFGADLNGNNSWLDKDIERITALGVDDLDKAKRIYWYVRDNYTRTAQSGVWLGKSLKTVYKNKAGTPGEINLLLTAMLDRAKVYANAVILSTRSNGFMDPRVPLQHSVNYVVSKVRFGSASYYLDASDPNVGFGQLPLQCYNGYGRVVDSTTRDMDILSADSVTEKKKVIVFVNNGEKGGLDGSVQSYPGMAEAAQIRKKVKAQTGEGRFRDSLQTGLQADGAAISDLEIDSLKNPDEPLGISYSYRLTPDSSSNLFYFTPTLVDRITENPFKAAERRYPVEMPYAKDQNYILTMEVPSGYQVEELPKSTMVRLGDSSGYFEYILSQDGDQIHFRTRIRLMKANYQPEEYAVLRDFYAAVVKKENEQIVFKKKK
jgi:hypothetical protein